MLASSDEEGGAGYQSESEPDEKIEKITHCALAHEVDAEELERHGTQAAIDAGEKARRARKSASAGAAKSPPASAQKRRSSKAGDPSGVYLFCVKWEGCSYRRRSWETEEDVKAAYKAASSCRAQRGWGRTSTRARALPEPYLVVDRVLDSREDLPAEERDDANEKKDEKKDEGKEEEDDSSRDESDSEELGTQYLVKWKGLGYSEATWEAAADLSSEADLDAVRRHERREDLKAKKAVHKDAVERAKAGTKPPLKPDPPAFKNDMSLREYQVTSFEWMVGNYRRRRTSSWARWPGKTAQCVAVMEHVRTTHLRAPRPFS